MSLLRSTFRRYPFFALFLLSMTLVLKAVLPNGYMLQSKPGSMTLMVTICTGMDTIKQSITIPMDKDADKPVHEKSDNQCAFSALSHHAIGGADDFLLAILLIFILAMGFAAVNAHFMPAQRHLRPPLRGPPIAI